MKVAAFEWGDFSEKQLRSVAEAQFRANLWHGAVRSGKTIGSIVRWLAHIEELKRSKGHFLMTGVTIGTLKDNILDVIESMVGPENYHYSAGSREVHICGIRVLIRGASDEAAEKKIRGLTLKGHYGDECTLWPRNYYKRGMDRLSVEGAKFFGTTNPDSPYHWLKTEYIDREDELDLNSYHFELSDNPNLPGDYVENLKKEFSGLWYKRFIQGLWVVAEGAIFDNFDEDLHVVDELPEGFEKILVGIDYGTTNPTSVICLGLNRGVWYAFAESRHEGSASGRQRTDSQHSDALKLFLDNGGIVPRSIDVDPSAASFKRQLKNDGFSGIKSANNDVLDGIRNVHTALSSGTLKVHSSCVALIKEFATYVWDPKAQEVGEDKPIKANDHSLDALRYAAMRAFGKPRRDPVKKPLGA